MGAQVLMVPEVSDAEVTEWPSLGPSVVEFMEAYLVFGPGDLLGLPVKIDDDWFSLIDRAYQIFPRGHAREGKRRFDRVCWSLPKGSIKTEMMALIAAVELHQDGPVRFNGWDGHGNPKGRPVTDPYIPMVAYTEEQSDELAYHALKTILENSPIARDFDIGLERITRRSGEGRAVSLAGSPNARDGARTTFQCKDETHRWTSARLRAAHRTMDANLAKRPIAEPWSLETTTAYMIGENSVAEATHAYAQAVAAGTIAEPRLFFYHRQADPVRDLDSREAIRTSVEEATLPSQRSWRNFEGIVALWDDPTADHEYLDRVYCNRARAGSGQAFDLAKWDETLVQEDDGRDYVPADGSAITIGADGARYFDAFGIVGTEIESGYQWPIRIWQRPEWWPEDRDWEVPADEVEATIEEIHRRWRVVRGYYDPFYWRDEIDRWAGKYGLKKVAEFRTNQYSKMAYACRAYGEAWKAAQVLHGASPEFKRHLGAAVKQVQTFRDPHTGEPMWVIVKERKDSPKKIDASVAAVLSWEARSDAISSGDYAGPGPEMWTADDGILVLG